MTSKLSIDEFRIACQPDLRDPNEVLADLQSRRTHQSARASLVGYFGVDKFFEDPSKSVAVGDTFAYYRRNRWVVIGGSYEGLEFFQNLSGPMNLNLIGEVDTPRKLYWGNRKEPLYTIEDVLNPENYRNTKVRQKLLYRASSHFLPDLSWIDFREEGQYDLAKQLNHTWARLKEGDNNVHQHSLSTARYIQLWGRIKDDPFLKDKIYAHMYYWKGQPFGFRIGVIEGDTYYLLSNIGRYWGDDIPNMATTWWMTCFFHQIQKDHPEVKFINSGLSSEKGLIRWKQQWPHTPHFYYYRVLTGKE